MQVGVQPVDFGLQAGHLIVGDPQCRRITFRRGQIGAEIEQVVLNPAKHLVGVTLAMKPCQTDYRIRLVDLAKGCRTARMLGHTPAIDEACLATVTGAGVDLVQLYHQRESLDVVVMRWRVGGFGTRAGLAAFPPDQEQDHHKRNGLEDNAVAHDPVGIPDIVLAAARHCQHAPSENAGNDAERGEKNDLVHGHGLSAACC